MRAQITRVNWAIYALANNHYYRFIWNLMFVSFLATTQPNNRTTDDSNLFICLFVWFIYMCKFMKLNSSPRNEDHFCFDLIWKWKTMKYNINSGMPDKNPFSNYYYFLFSVHWFTCNFLFGHLAYNTKITYILPPTTNLDSTILLKATAKKGGFQWFSNVYLSVWGMNWE